MSKTTPTTTAGTPPEAPPPPPGGAFLALVKREDAGDAAARAEVRRVHDELPELWRITGDLADQAARAWMTTAMGKKRRTAVEATERMAADLRQQLAGPDAPPLERLLAERAVVCWLQLNYVDTILAQRLGGDGLSRGQIEMYQDWLDRAQKRYLAALKTLAQVRKLLVPVVQVNIADKQVNVGSMTGVGAGVSTDAE